MSAAQNPGDPYDRRRCRSRPQEDQSPASNVHTSRGEGPALQISAPPHAQLREPASCHSTQTALGTPQINSSTFGRIGHPDTHDPAACSRARPGPKSRAADQPPRRTRTHGSPGAHLFRSSQQVREARTRQVARHRIVAGRPRPRAARRRPSAAAGRLSTETPPHGQVHGGFICQALTVLRRQPDTPCPLFSLSQCGSRSSTMPCSATHPAGAVAGCRSQGSATTRSCPHAVRRRPSRGRQQPGFPARCAASDAPAPRGGARR